MHKYILFSAVGTTDPISFHHDGAILHISRVYRPEKIYLFFSEEMNELHKKDNRYFYSIRKLSELLDDFQPELHEIVAEDLKEAHKFDVFYDYFESILLKIRAENPDYKILLNVSSGTPAMKSALNLIAALNDESYQAVQVRSPFASSNPKTNDIREYKPTVEWEENKDNVSNFENRTVFERNLNLIARIKKEIIQKHIQVYDYPAALAIAEEISTQISDMGMKLLKAAYCRLQLDEQGMDKVLSGSGIKLVEMEHGSERNLIEFLLWLNIKQERQEYADFIRGITPAVADLFELILKEQVGIKLSDFCIEKKYGFNNSVFHIKREQLEKTEKGREYLRVLERSRRISGKLKDGPYSSIHALILMEEYYKGNSSELLILMDNIRSVENKVRNLAAHEITSITKEWITNRCGFPPARIIEFLKKLVAYTGITLPDDIWDSYHTMNDKIKEYLMEGKLEHE
jgi:CRISPR type III-A/MTUBE-associated protein Csm6